MSDNHGHDHGHDQKPHPGAAKDEVLSHYARVAQAIDELLVEKGTLTRDEIERQVTDIESRSPRDGARVVARAWTDPAFKARLLENARDTLLDLGYDVGEAPVIRVVENTEKVRHVIVCTLCSCYPRALLGRPPDWYKSLAYRQRAVVEPRAVMKEFGLTAPDDVEVRVLDSTADLRYMVLPRRPEGTEGMSEEELAELVTRDSLIGVSDPLEPRATARR